ncbi:MAG TPA: hypothetical protein VEZ12_23335, partial [Herpetosiphonaceae bacterium]|nr:hypothetical protein [Herpetosiphonaceae bacterium]
MSSPDTTPNTLRTQNRQSTPRANAQPDEQRASRHATRGQDGQHTAEDGTADVAGARHEPARAA